jgi:predicted metallopeptidase
LRLVEEQKKRVVEGRKQRVVHIYVADVEVAQGWNSRTRGYSTIMWVNSQGLQTLDIFPNAVLASALQSWNVRKVSRRMFVGEIPLRSR